MDSSIGHIDQVAFDRVPSPEFRIRFFPRRFFAFLRQRVEDKYSFHPLLFARQLLPTSPDLPAGYCFTVLNNELLNAMLAHGEALPAQVYRNRLAQGDCCYCLEVAGELVAYQWISRTTCCIFRGMDHAIDFLPLAPNQAFTYDFYTYRQQRNKGYGSVLKKQVYKALSDSGVSEVMSCVLPNNRASRNIHLREGFALKALPYNFRIMNWSFTLWGDESKVKEMSAWLQRIAATLESKS